MNDYIKLNEVIQIAKLIKTVRSAAYKYHVKQYHINCFYIAYIASNSDIHAYIKGYQFSLSVAPLSKCKVLDQMLKLKLIERVQRNLYVFTPLSIEIIKYIDSELAK